VPGDDTDNFTYTQNEADLRRRQEYEKARYDRQMRRQKRRAQLQILEQQKSAELQEILDNLAADLTPEGLQQAKAAIDILRTSVFAERLKTNKIQALRFAYRTLKYGTDADRIDPVLLFLIKARIVLEGGGILAGQSLDNGNGGQQILEELAQLEQQSPRNWHKILYCLRQMPIEWRLRRLIDGGMVTPIEALESMYYHLIGAPSPRERLIGYNWPTSGSAIGELEILERLAEEGLLVEIQGERSGLLSPDLSVTDYLNGRARRRFIELKKVHFKGIYNRLTTELIRKAAQQLEAGLALVGSSRQQRIDNRFGDEAGGTIWLTIEAPNLPDNEFSNLRDKLRARVETLDETNDMVGVDAIIVIVERFGVRAVNQEVLLTLYREPTTGDWGESHAYIDLLLGHP
jgi:hypothetical protein